MRTIEFRGKRVDNGEWVYGYVDATMYKDIVVIHTETGTFGVNPETVGQFTGLHDKNGNAIYEGDIFKMSTLDGVISWHPNGYWCLHVSQDDVREHSYITLGELIEYAIRENHDFEVIGNIHDNQDIPKGGEE